MGGAVLLLAVVAATFALRSCDQRQVVRSANGELIRLEDYRFQEGTVRYDLPIQPVAQALGGLVPGMVRERLGWPRHRVTGLITSISQDEPILSAAFSSRDASGRWEGTGTRIVVLDDQGQSYDPVLNQLGNSGIFGAAAFPRRGRELRLRLMDGNETKAEFAIKNPCPGPYPVWKPRPLPLAVTKDGLEVSLEKFVADAAHQRTICSLRVREHEKETAAFVPAAIEISDATGNRWRPPVDAIVNGTTGWVTVSVFGALWPAEEAWRLRVELKAATGESEPETPCVVAFMAKPEQAGSDAPPPATENKRAAAR